MTGSSSKVTDGIAIACPRHRRPGVRALFYLVVTTGGLLAVVGTALALGMQSTPSAGMPDRDLVSIPDAPFTDITLDAGITFVHENGASGEKLLPETMGGGSAFLDYDDDGDQDLLFVNSRPWTDEPNGMTGDRPTMALYRNDGHGHFEDVTAGSGLDVTLYGMGAAVGDYDGDGHIDVFLSAVGANRLFHNRGDGRFVDVTAAANVAGDAHGWSTACGWFDYDNDGDLDLFVSNYLKWSPELDRAQNFRLPDGGAAYGRPQNFEGSFPYLYRNDGGGAFTDVSSQAGLQIRDASGAAMAKSLGVTFNDFDGDGWLDIVVANDTAQNQFFHNRGNGTFREMGAMAGIAFDPSGNVRGAMGIDSAHFRSDDDAVGVAIGNFSDEMAALYVSHGNDIQFSDEAARRGLGPATRRDLSFGVCYVDYDLDGRLDLFVANGHLEQDINRVQPAQQYEQSPQLFWNAGSQAGAEFVPVSPERSGRDFSRPMVGRGASFADIDGDGDLDLLIAAPGRRPRLLRNDQTLGNHWLRLKLTGTRSNRSAIGALVEVHLADRTLRRRVMPTRSYLSQVELPLTIGLGPRDRVPSVTIHWPDGSRQVLEDLRADRSYDVEQTETATSTHWAVETAPGVESPVPALYQTWAGDRDLVTFARAGSTCGDYLHAADASGEDSRSDTPISSGVPRPCHGPRCSGGSGYPYSPFSTPIQLAKWHKQPLICVAHPLGTNPVPHAFLPDTQRNMPSTLSGRLFRPPRPLTLQFPV